MSSAAAVMRAVVRGVVPPVLMAASRPPRRWAARRFGRSRLDWEYLPGGWRPDGAGLRGWDVSSVAKAYESHWPSFRTALEGPGPLGIDFEVLAGQDVSRESQVAHHRVMAFGYVLARAARGRSELSVLDWGGALGHYYWLARRLVPDVGLDYHCVEVPEVARVGARCSPDVTFHVDDEWSRARYDLVMSSSSLQYEYDWADRLRRLGAITGQYLYLTRLPVAMESESFVVVQRPYGHGYATEYQGWVINRERLLGVAGDAGLRLERELLMTEGFELPDGPERDVWYRGFLFRGPESAGRDGV
jgi:putative methyltransferase (TIGR04325 family)